MTIILDLPDEFLGVPPQYGATDLEHVRQAGDSIQQSQEDQCGDRCG